MVYEIKQKLKVLIERSFAAKLAVRSVKVLIGEFVCAVGVVTTINAGIGLAPWVVFFQGTSRVTLLSIGQASILSSFIIIIALVCLKENLGLGTIYDMTAAGIFLDLLIAWDIVPRAKGLLSGVLLMVLGLFIIALGCYIYMKQGLGAGPRDALMVALSKRNRFSPGTNRIVIEASACALGFLMGGVVGIGTVIAAFGLGAAIQTVFGALKFDAEIIEQETLLDTWHKLKKPAVISIPDSDVNANGDGQTKNNVRQGTYLT